MPKATATAKRAWSFAGALASWLGDAAWWLDRVTYGHRLACLTVAGAAVLLAKNFFIDAYVAALLVYTSLLYLLMLARLWWVRDETGHWTWKYFNERAFATTRDAMAGSLEDFSLQNLLERLRGGLVAAGLGLAVLAPPLGMLTRSIFSAGTITELLGTLEMVGQFLIGFGLIAWLLKSLQRRSATARAFKQSAAALTRSSALHNAPLIIDLRQPATWNGQVPPEFEPLLGILARWKPRAKDREADYERSLVHFLERNVPGIDAQTQLPFEAPDGTRGRIDIVLDDVVAIELKRDLRLASVADRTVGQVLKYAASWQKGPVMLLLCEASAEIAELPVLKRIAELREAGRSLFVVAAGR